MNLSIYRFKPEQGRYTRGIAFLLLTLLGGYGCRTLYFFLHWPWAKENFLEGPIPIINVGLDLSLIISVVLFLLIEWFLVWLINRPKTGTLLIDTETEMKKVTWPSWKESFNSSLVVLVGVIFFMIFLGFSDVVLNFLFNKIIFGGLS